MTVPRVVIAAPASGQGKTTIATGLMAALRAVGLTVSGHKIGPDFVDPSYHAAATGLPARNLDPYLQGEQRLAPLLRHGALTSDVAVIEGLMGLFDGAPGTDGYASTAHVASVLAAPVVLVVDASAASRSVAALVYGFAQYDSRVGLAGVILNKLGSRRHEDEIRDALTPTGVPILGALYQRDHIHAPSRHLGLVPAGERFAETVSLLESLAEWVRCGVDLAALMRVARGAAGLPGPSWVPAEALVTAEADAGAAEALVTAEADAGAAEALVTAEADAGAAEASSGWQRGRSVIAAISSNSLRYTETSELLDAAGVDVVDVDPLTDDRLPDMCAGLYLGGGFPESYSESLSANRSLRERVGSAIADGAPTVAECAGLLYLCSDVDGLPMVGALDASARMTDRGALAYRTAVCPEDNLLAASGQRVTGHEFHRTEVSPSHGERAAWQWDAERSGFASARINASYLNVHWAGYPMLAARFADAVHAYARAKAQRP